MLRFYIKYAYIKAHNSGDMNVLFVKKKPKKTPWLIHYNDVYMRIMTRQISDKSCLQLAQVLRLTANSC